MVEAEIAEYDHARRELHLPKLVTVRRPLRPVLRGVWTEIYLCGACSYREILSISC
jgi:hypothetical protein